MDAKTILIYQLENGRDLFAGLIGSMTDAEWRQRLHPGGPMLGFVAWHLPAIVDWTVHAWLSDTPMLRTRPALSHQGINPPLPPFGMSVEEADAIARGVARAAVLAYGDAAWSAALGWLAAASGDDLARVPDAYDRAAAGHERWPEYIDEVAWMRGRPAWQMLAGPCFGHIRGHFGELDAALTALRRQS